MGTTLTPEFWRQFAVLLVIATAVVVVTGAALDALVLRMRGRRTPRRPPVPPATRERRSTHGAFVHH